MCVALLGAAVFDESILQLKVGASTPLLKTLLLLFNLAKPCTPDTNEYIPINKMKFWIVIVQLFEEGIYNRPRGQ